MPEVITQFDRMGNPLTPLEAGTNIPLPIWAPGDGKTNDHHAYFRKKDWEKGLPHVRALRYSRIQNAIRSGHRLHHNEYFIGTPFPKNVEEAFGAVVLNSVGYIPSHAIDVTRKESKIIEVSPFMRKELQKPGVIKFDRRSSKQAEVGKFLMDYAIWQKFDDDEMLLIEQFLSIKPEDVEKDELARRRRYNLGIQLAEKAIAIAVDPLNHDYQEARHRHAISETAPVSPFDAVKRVVNGYEQDYFGTLEQNLRFSFAA